MTNEQIIELCKKLFLDYVNNFLTVDYLCEYYNMNRQICEKMLSIGAYYQNKPKEVIQ